MFFIEQLPNIFEHSKTTKQQNIQAITIWITPHKFTIVPNLNRSRIPTILEINRQTTHILEHQKLNSSRYDEGIPHFFSCIIGIMDIGGKKVILLGQQVVLVGNIGQRQIFRIVKPIYLFYDHRDKKNLNETQAAILLNTTAIFQQGMYFSYAYDMGSRLDRRGETRGGLFNWAENFQSELKKCDRMWRVTMIQGFVGKLQLHINGSKLSIVLISRRATKRGGTQSYTRGIDSQGQTGNYVETEQIISSNDKHFSFLMLRGSAPLFWSQTKSSYGLHTSKCTGDIDTNYDAFKKHLISINERTDFRHLFLVNLLSATSGKQQKIVQNYQYLIRKLTKEESMKDSLGSQVYYIFFDLHNRCYNKEYSDLNSFLEGDLAEAVRSCGFTATVVDRENKRVENVRGQRGAFRVSCYNCIDRTNIFQSRIAAMKLIETLRCLDVQLNQFKDGLAFFGRDSPFSRLYRNLWADNGDALSKQYIGTGSTESFAVRKGKLSYLATLDHGMKSIYRVIRDIRNEDKKKQDAICFILGEQIQEDKPEKPQQGSAGGLKVLDDNQRLHASEANNRYITI